MCFLTVFSFNQRGNVEMDSECCVASNATPRIDEQVMITQMDEVWSGIPGNHPQEFLDSWLLQMQVGFIILYLLLCSFKF